MFLLFNILRTIEGPLKESYAPCEILVKDIFYDNCRGSNFLKLSPGTKSPEAYSWQLFFRDIKVWFKEKLSGYSSSSQEQCVGCFRVRVM